MQVSRKAITIFSIITFIGLGIATVIMCGILLTKENKNDVEKTITTKTVKDKETNKPISTSQHSEEVDELQQMKEHHFFTLGNPNMRIVNDIIVIDNKYQCTIFTSPDNPQHLVLENRQMPNFEHINNICEKFNLNHMVDEEEVLQDLRFLEQKYARNRTVYYTNIIEFNGFLYNFILNFQPHYETKKFVSYYMNYKESDFGEWENEHSYIQYLFPGMYMSTTAPEKILFKSLACLFAKSDKYRHFLKCFAYNFGLFLVDFCDRTRFLTKKQDDHNKKRITRVIRCLRLFGEYKIADAFFDLVKKFCSSGDEDPAVKNQWKKVLKMDCLEVIRSNLDESLRQY